MSAGMFDEVFAKPTGRRFFSSIWMSSSSSDPGDAEEVNEETALAAPRPTAATSRRTPVFVIDEYLVNRENGSMQSSGSSTRYTISRPKGSSVARWVYAADLQSKFRLCRPHLLSTEEDRRDVYSNTVDPLRLIAIHAVLLWSKRRGLALFNRIKSEVESETSFEFADDITRWQMLHRIWCDSDYLMQLQQHCEADAAAASEPGSYRFNALVNRIVCRIQRRPPGDCAITVWKIQRDIDVDDE